MNMSIRVSFLAGIVGVFFYSCESEAVEVVSDFPEPVAQIIETNCAVSGCHAGNNAPENLNLTTWSSTLEGSDFGSVIIPYHAQWSHLFQHVNTYPDLGVRAEPVMPPGGEVLSKSDVQIIQNWIDEGALNRDGLRPWAAKEQTANGKVFSLCAGSDLIAVTDLESNLVMRFIPVGQDDNSNESPHFIELSPDGQFLYVTMLLGGIVEKYRTDNYQFAGRVEVGSDPALIEISPDGQRAIISHWNAISGSPKLTLLDAENMAIVDQVVGSGELLSFGHGMATTSDFSLLYVVANEGNYYAKYQIGEQSLAEIDKFSIAPRQAPIPQATKAYQPYHCLLSPDESMFFITCNQTNEVRVFNTANDELIANIPTGDFPRLMTYDPVDHRLYVACANEENFSQQGSMRGCVSVIDIETLSNIGNIYRLGHRPHGISISISKRLLYVSSENNGSGNEDPPHHYIEGTEGVPGKYNVVDLQTLKVIRGMETEIAVYPNALIVND